jgi:hypothetical protein
MPTVLPSSYDRSLNVPLSSRDDTSDDLSTTDQYLRNKRFFINKNQFVVSSTLTTFAFVNTTTTVTINLIPAAQFEPVNGPCAPLQADVAAGIPACVSCLPAGYVVCPVNG